MYDARKRICHVPTFVVNISIVPVVHETRADRCY